MSGQQDPRLAYRPGEVADLTGLSRTTVYSLMRSGELGFVSIGRARRVPRSEVERWLSEQLAAERGHDRP